MDVSKRAIRARWGRARGRARAQHGAELWPWHLAWCGGSSLFGLGVYLSSHVGLGIGWGWLALSLFLLLLLLYGRVAYTDSKGVQAVAAWVGYAALLLGGVAALLLGWARGARAWDAAECHIPRRDGVVALVTVGEARGMAREGYVHAIQGSGSEPPCITIGQRVVLLPAWGDSTLFSLPHGATCMMSLDSVQDGSWRNPHAFDYARWLRLHGVVAQRRVRRGSVLRVDSMELAQVDLPDRVRFALMRHLAAHVGDSVALGLMQAMALGERAALDRAVQASFRQSGLSHILALSGLHVGFLYGVLLLFTQFFHKDRWGLRLLRHGVPLLGVWLFTLVVGASPSLLRAALMLSVVSLARILLRRNSGFVALSAAGCVALTLDPLTLWDAGFQLSFSALAGIFLFFEPLRRRLWTRQRLGRWLRDTVCVTLSAQIGTLAVTLGLFGTLPVWSVVANVAAIPLASLLMPGALFLSVLPADWSVGVWLAWPLEWLARGLVWSAERISTLPYAQLPGLTLRTQEAAVLGAAILLLGMGLRAGRRWLLVCGGLLTLVPLGLLAQRGVQHAGEDAIVVLHRYGGTEVAARQGVSITSLQGQIAHRSHQLLSAYAAYMPLHSIGALPSSSVRVDSLAYGVCVRHAGQRVLIAQPWRGSLGEDGGAVDVLIPGAMAMEPFRVLAEKLQPSLVVVDGCTKRRMSRQIRAWCLERGIAFHSTYDDGYWEVVAPAP